MTKTIKEKKLEQCINCLEHTCLTLIIDDESDVFEQCCCSRCGYNTMRRQEWGLPEVNFMSKDEIDRLHTRFSSSYNREEQAR